MGDLLAVLDAQGRLRSIHTLSGQVREFTHEPPARLLLADPTARSVLTVSGEDRLDHWDVQQGRRLSTLMVGRKVTSAQFHPKGDRVLVGSADGTAEVLSLSDNKVVGQPMHHGPTLRQVLWFSDGGRLLTVGGPQVRFWEATSTQPSPVRLVHSSDIHHVALFADGARGVSLSKDGEMKVWDAISGEVLGPVLKADVNPQSLSVSPDGLFIGVGSSYGLTLWAQGTDGLWTVRSRHPGWDGSWIFSRNSLEVWVSRADGVVVRLDLMEHAQTVSPLDGAWVELVAGREFSGDHIESLSLEQMTTHRHRWMTSLPTDSTPASLAERHAQRAEVLSGRQQWFAANHHWSEAVKGDPRRLEWKHRRDEALSNLRSGRAVPALTDLPARAPDLTANQVDLSKWFNAGLSNAWLGGSGNDLRELVAAGLPQRTLAFDLRGVVQLGSPASDNLGRSFPRSVEGIKIGQRALRLQFIHGAAWDAIHRTRIGSYRVRYQDGQSREVDLLFGENIGNWWCTPQSSRRFGAAAVVWQGSNEASRNVGMEIRLFQMAWINPKPDQIIDSIDFIAAGESSAPFLIALSLE
ncbi:MAG: hypothetical protein FJ405_02885 [Verrucomicrobia bacterium]|nr:hypothetical protein [Verrucomicrobiota bacterium]